MFETNEAYDAMLETLWGIVADLERGSVLTHGEIQEVLGCQPHTEHWPTVMKRLRRRLLEERGIATWPQTTVGYKLLTTQEQLEFLPRERARRAERQFRRSVKAVKACPDKGLTLHQRRIKASQLEAMRRAAKDARAARKIQEATKVKSDRAMPRRIQLA